MRHFKLTFDRALSRGAQWQLLIIGCIILLSLILSYGLLAFSGDWVKFCDDHMINKFMLPLYLLIDQNLFGEIYMGSYSEIDETMVSYGNWFGIASGITFLIGVIFFNGAIIAILSNFIERRVENYENGQTHYLKKGHYVIMGYDDIVPSIISYILSDEHEPDADILLLTSTPASLIHEKLRESVKRKYHKNIIVNYGHRTSDDYYKDIHLEAAKQIYITGDRHEPQHDALNVECVENVCKYLKSQPSHTVKQITCVFEDLDTYTAFRTTDIFKDSIDGLNIDFIPYNFYVNWARRVFVERSYERNTDVGNKDRKEFYPYLCKQGITADDEHYVHLVFVGMSGFAVTFANEAAHLLHFPNFAKAHTKITFIDIKADKEMPIFITRNHNFFDIQSYSYQDLMSSNDSQPAYYERRFEGKDADFLDIDFEFIKGDIFSQRVQKLLCSWAEDGNQYLSVFLAMANQRDNFAVAMNMPDAIYNMEIPIFVRQDSSDNFITLLRQADECAPRKGDPEYRTYEDGQVKRKEAHGRYAHIYPFGMHNTSFFAEDTSFKRAKLINYLYDTADYDSHIFQPLEQLAKKSRAEIENEANEKWKKHLVAEQWSSIYFAYNLDYKLIALRALRDLDIADTSHDLDELTEQEINIIGEVEHNRWNVEKLLMGYRKPLEKEDSYNKPQELAEKLENNKRLFIHAQIRPYNELTTEMKKFDLELAKYIPWIIETTNEERTK